MADVADDIGEMTKHEASQAQGLISGKDLCKSFNTSGVRVEVLKSVDVDISLGDTLAVVGASGIGKSTLLNILGTLDRPDRGKLYTGILPDPRTDHADDLYRGPIPPHRTLHENAHVE